MNVIEQFDSDFKEALKAKDHARLSILRLVRSALQNAEINKRGDISDQEVIEVIQREIKQHHESVDAFNKANRPDDVARLTSEIRVLEKYLPPQLSEDDLRNVVAAAISETGAASLSDMGKVMGSIMPKVAGRTTGDKVGAMVRSVLGK